RPLHLTPQCLPRPRLSSPLSSCRDAPPRPLHSFPTRRSSDLYGGVDMKAQIAELKEGREIIVATPGRLLDHVQPKTVNFNQVEMRVLDEADRMLDMGFIPDIKRILALLPKERQSLLFSATFSDEIKKLADTMLKAPQLIEVAKRNTVSETITHRMHPVATDLKRSLLT